VNELMSARHLSEVVPGIEIRHPANVQLGVIITGEVNTNIRRFPDSQQEYRPGGGHEKK